MSGSALSGRADLPPAGGAVGRATEAARPASGGAGATLAWLGVAALVAVLAAWQATVLLLTYHEHPRLPLWDMAGHAWQGLVAARDLEEGRIGRLLLDLNRQSTWPFAYSLYLVPFFLVGGHGFGPPTLANAVLFALVPLALLVAARELDGGPAGPTTGGLAAALFLVSPLPRAFGLVVMRELAGVLVSILALALYLRALRRGTLAAYRAAGLAGLILFFVKYNYGVLWLLGVAAHRLVAWPAETRARRLHRAAAWLWPWPTRDRSRITVALGCYAVLVLLWVGRGVFLYGVAVGGVAVAGWLLWTRAPRVGRWWRGLPPPDRAAVETLLLPIWLWCLIPQPFHLRAMVGTLVNRSSDIPLFSASGLLYYVPVFTGEYAPDARLGGLVLAAAVLSAAVLWRAAEPFRVLAIAAGVQWLAVGLHPFKVPRFLMTAVPFVLLLAAAGVARGASRLGGRHGPWLLAGMAATPGILAAGWLAHPAAQARLVADYDGYSADARLADVLAFIDDSLPSEGAVAVVGAFAQLSPTLIRWTLLERRDRRTFRMVREPRRLPVGTDADRVRAVFAAWVAQGRPDEIVGIRVDASGPYYASQDYQRYTAGQLAFLAALTADPGWRPRARRDFEPLGVQVVVLERIRAPGAPR